MPKVRIVTDGAHGANGSAGGSGSYGGSDGWDGTSGEPGDHARPISITLAFDSGRALATIEPILDYLRALPGIEWALPVGSLRRGQDTVGDIEILATSTDMSWPRSAATA